MCRHELAGKTQVASRAALEEKCQQHLGQPAGEVEARLVRLKAGLNQLAKGASPCSDKQMPMEWGWGGHEGT